jgi:hypothetical protein
MEVVDCVNILAYYNVVTIRVFHGLSEPTEWSNLPVCWLLKHSTFLKNCRKSTLAYFVKPTEEEIKYNSIDTWTQYYLTFYDHNLQMLKINAIMFALGKPF